MEVDVIGLNSMIGFVIENNQPILITTFLGRGGEGRGGILVDCAYQFDNFSSWRDGKLCEI